MFKRCAVAIVLFALAGCADDRPEWLDARLEVEGPLAADGRFVYLHQSFEELIFVTPSYRAAALSVSVDRVAVGSRPQTPVVTPDGELVLVINSGDQTLSVVEVASRREHRLELPSDYDALAISPDSRFVVAHFANAESGGSGDSVFRNQNEITIFDLNPGAGDGGERLAQVDERILTLRSSPEGLDFAPPFTMQGQTHYLLVVRAVSALTLVDLTAENEVDLQRRIFFVPENSARRLIPQRIIFTEDDPADDLDMRMFVLTTDSQDIFEISILPPSAEDDKALALSLNQFPGGPQPVEMLSYFDDEGDQKLLMINRSPRRLVVVDVDTGNSVDIDINWTVSRALQYDLVDDESGVAESFALLYEANSPTVLFVDLDQLETRGTRAIEALALDRSVASISLVAGTDAETATVIHSGSRALSVLNLRQRFAIPLPGSATVRNIAFSPDGDHLFAVVAELPEMGIIDLENGHPSGVDLPAPGLSVAVLDDPQVILVDHGYEEGRMTFLNLVEPSDETSRTLEGLFLENVFDEARREREE